MIDEPLSSLRAWTQAFSDAEIPVLPGSVAEMAQLHAIEEANGSVDAHTLADSFGNDPLMTLKVLVHVSRMCMRQSIEPPEALVGAIVMQGVGPFFKAFASTPDVLSWLRPYPEALSGLLKVITRARRASNFALRFAVHRQDEDVMVMQEAALLHDFAEMLLWCHAPKLATEMARRQKADFHIRSADIQNEVLGIELVDLGQSLMQHWHLPELLRQTTDDHNAHHPKVRTVMLAVRLARHTQYGWQDPHALAALPDDIADIAQLLTLSNDAARRLVEGLDNVQPSVKPIQ
ncbi:HDOD domain-containing protein [Aquabacterium sp.]|uniref:HDOD domain-containing protein n=1 Tax=Aquabacterium sp. TaxID=1872578 RepID=UPI002E31E668|nr:HDOD domain-containing protein [Aquabacterium sp.]HEX5312631.1 HDOD domain-containing protein [Aquabacterium sp.]